MNNLEIYTDGAFSSCRKKGGLGIVILNNKKLIKQYSNCFINCSNNKMELSAIIIALRFITKQIDSLIIYSDSMYCIGCATLGWQRKKNKKLWKEFDKQLERVSQLCPKIEFVHIKGHQKDNSEFTKWNNMVDKLAVRESQSL